MIISNEIIVTLTSLKEIGVKGFGTQKILAIGNKLRKSSSSVANLSELYDVFQEMEEPIFHSITQSDLIKANDFAKKLIEESESLGISHIGYFDPSFPESLRHTIDETGKKTPPSLIWYRGDLSLSNKPGIAVIGTRDATPDAIAGGRYLSAEFAKRGFNIVSGLAKGCDTSGHLGALDVHGKTTAILADGLDVESIYPPENIGLAKRIIDEGGLIISEYHIRQKANRYNLVARDRLQPALALATLVIQTGIKGGTMHAANATLSAKKPLYTMLFKNAATNSLDICKGNAELVSRGARYISGVDLNNTLNKITGELLTNIA